MGENFVNINGKRYDAKTGRLLSTTNKHSAKPKPLHSSGSLEGVSRHTPTAQAQKIHRKPEKSKTLMRHAVKKPVIAKSLSGMSAPTNKPAPKTEITSNHIHHDEKRAVRAASMPKSSLISRFGPSNPPVITKNHKVAHVPVAKAPAVSEHSIAPISTPESIAQNPFQTALDNATSHTQTKPQKIKKHRVAKALRISPRTANLGFFALGLVLISGFFVYQNVPNMSMRIAATRSGVSANMPGYKPAGFALSSNVQYKPGQISISYKSTTDDRSFQITQSNSEWNNDALVSNFVSTNRRAYQTFQDKDKTIYIYDDNNATWVDKGVWYQVEGKSSLNNDQLIRIANSL